MASGGKQIRLIKLYRCGHCENNLARVFRGEPPETRKFPALAVLLRHRRRGYLLYDTGYSQAVLGDSPRSRAYRWLNPTFCEPEDQISHKLRRDGVSPEEIRTVILSHAHPDHMGGLPLLPSCRLVAAAGTLEAMRRPSPRDLVFPELAPGPSVPLLPLKGHMPDHFLRRYFSSVCDIFGDGSLLGVGLPGHSAGQLGLFVAEWNLFFAADASWGGDLLEKAPRMRLAARLIQKDYAAYCRTARQLRRLGREHPEIRILFSHEEFQEETYAE